MKPPPPADEVTRRSKRRRHARSPSDATTARQNGSPGEEYRVGPGHPPREFQFKPGMSGNPKGAKRKGKSLVPDLKALFKRALNKNAKHDERAKIITKLEAGFDELGNQFAAGDRYARRDVFYYADKLGIDLTASQGNARHVDASTDAEFRQALLDRGIPARLWPPIDEAGLEPPADPPLPPDVEKEENKQ
jgi:uncharacterized protein DUF5681